MNITELTDPVAIKALSELKDRQPEHALVENLFAHISNGTWGSLD